jgi:Lon protease-like protein
MELPLFPLHTVLCPGVALPLHVFEPRYRALVSTCLATGAPFGVVLIRAGREVGGGSTSIATVGTTAEIREAEALEDGRYRILAVGTHRFRIDSVTVGREPYLLGEVELIDEPVGDRLVARHLTDRVTRRFLRYLTLLQPMDGEDAAEVDVQVEVEIDAEEAPGDLPPEAAGPGDAGALGDDAAAAAERLDEIVRRVAIPDDPTILSYLLSGIVQVEPPKRQRLLEAETTEERLRELLRLLDREIVLLERRLRSYTIDPRRAALRRN